MHFFTHSRGFTLIELMIVVAIISILAMIAIPSYQSYTERARFTEVITAAQFFKTAVTLALQEGYPLNELTNGQHGIPINASSTKNLEAVSVTNGIITATASALLKNVTYILKPNKDGSLWLVGGTCIKSGLCHVD